MQYRIKTIISLLRIDHWIKNGTVLLPVFFAGQFFRMPESNLYHVLITIVSFCMASSFIYVVNDLKDLEKDRLHPKKRYRPIASGALGTREAKWMAAFLLLCVVVLQYFLNWYISVCIGSYLLINIFYCYGMKNIAIIDVTSISLGFILRLLGGAFAGEVPITHWMIVLTFLLMFSVALAKRRDDLVLTQGTGQVLRGAQSGYNIQFIDIAKSISFAVTLVAYIIYSVSDDVIRRMHSPYVYVTSLPVFLGIMRYLQLSIVYEVTGSPVDLLKTDKFLMAVILVWVLLFIFILYA